MKILAIYRHYWPDATPYARLLRAILEEQIAQGHQATVFTAQPSYNDLTFPKQPSRENLNGVEIRRIRLLPERKNWGIVRAINFLYFLVRAVIFTLRNRDSDLIIANTHPPILIGIALRLIKRLTGTIYLLHCQDIHPESAILAGQLRAGWWARLLQRIDTSNCMAAKRVVALSADMRETLLSRPEYTTDNIQVLNNFALDVYHPTNSLPKLFADRNEIQFLVLFAGNMGKFQDLPRLMDAIHLLSHESRIQFVFMGAGAERQRVEELAHELVGKTAFFEPFQSVEVAFACMQRADLGVVSLADGVCKVAYPSKTMTYLAASCPILLLAERDSQLAIDVLSNRFGYVPNSTTADDIASTIRLAWNDRNRWTPAARNELIERGTQLFGREQILTHWSMLFRDLSPATNSPHHVQDTSTAQTPSQAA